MRNAQIARELARINDPIQAERYVDVEETRRQARERPFADSLQAYSGIFASTNGTLWVVDAIAPGDTGWSATAFRTDGAIVARLHSTSGSMPVHFGNDRVIVRVEDEKQNVSFRVHRMVGAR